jgi:hypothetical protein
MSDLRFITNSAWSVIRFFRMGGLMLQIHPKSYLRRRGWFKSFSVKRSVDSMGAAIPWWSYGAIDFVESRLNTTMNVLEFGSGGSTVWLASRVNSVVSIENDPEWTKIVKTFIPNNVELIELNNPEDFSEKFFKGSQRHFQVLIIDPLAHRINCAKAGLQFISDDGIVIWDNTDGPDWNDIKLLLASNGYREISFSGLPPQEVCEDRTTIFYRSKNVFGI